MISFGATAMTALSPWMLAAAPVAAGMLIYIYRKRGSSTQRVVSSLFLMRSLPRATPGKRRFVPPLQFWIELLLFSLLACAAATLVLNKHGKHIAVVLDNSFSMSALDRAGASRLDRIKSMARADITQTLPPTRFTVFTANASLDSISSRGISTAAALAAVTGTSQELSGDTISKHLESLLLQGDFDSVWVYTDHPFQDVTTPQRTRVITLPSESADTANAWLSNLTVREKGGESAISATVHSSIRNTLSVSVGAKCFQGSSQFDLSPTSLSLEFKKSQTLQLPVGSKTWSYCRVSLILPPGTFDALAGDNESWIANNLKASSIKVVSPLSPEELGLSKIKTLSFSKAADAPSTATIFHRTAQSQTSSPIASLAVFPPAGPLLQGGSVQAEGISSATEITRWDSSHPVLTYVNPSLLKVPIARRITCPESSTPLLFSRTGALACAGEYDGVRYAIVGFELFPFDGKKTPTLSILTLNLLSWVSQQTGIAAHGAPAGIIPLPPGITAARYVAPIEERLSILDGRASVYARRPGIIELLSGDEARLIGVQLPSEAESELTQVSMIELPSADSEPKSKKESESTNLTPWLALLALGALVLDLVRRLVRKQRWIAS
jgi:hypothetical protein